MTKPEIAQELRRLANQMVNLGSDIRFYGGSREMERHGGEMLGAGMVAREWSASIEAEL